MGGLEGPPKPPALGDAPAQPGRPSSNVPKPPALGGSRRTDRRLRGGAMHVAVARVAALTAHGHVLRLDGSDPVARDRALRLACIDPVEAPAVAREDGAFHQTV